MATRNSHLLFVLPFVLTAYGCKDGAGSSPVSSSRGAITVEDDDPDQSQFGFMFKKFLPFTNPTADQIAALATSMLDPNLPPENDVPSAFTYLGQFIDHDLTLDTLPQPSEPVDPTELFNARTFRFDLDSVYGGGPEVSPQLYAPDGAHFLIQESNANGVRDLPRDAAGSAILVEHRNDENEIISQVHTGFLKFHNALIDRGKTFKQAQRKTIRYYQWVVLHEFLPNLVGQGVVDGTMNGSIPRFYKPGNKHAPMTPVEFSVAAYRFGHSVVRKAYEVTTTTGKLQVFNGTAADLHGGRPLPAGRQIDWGNFLLELRRADTCPPVSDITQPIPRDPVPTGCHFNFSRKIDTLISSGLFNLPIPGAEAGGSNNLAFRNMLRAILYGMPSGQTVATKMGIAVIPPSQVTTMPGFENGSPLWFYILKESELAGGAKLGPVGGRIVADIFIRLMEIDKKSILNGHGHGHVDDDDCDGDDDNHGGQGDGFMPKPPIAPAPGEFKFADFLVFAGVATRP